MQYGLQRLRSNARACVLVSSLALIDCKDLDRFSTRGGAYCGDILPSLGGLVTRGFGEGVHMSMTFEVNNASSSVRSPGKLGTTDGLLIDADLRPIPALQYDPLSLLYFGEGRDKNFIYGIDPSDGGGPTLLAVVSLLTDGHAEVRLIRGAPPLPGAPADPSATPNPGAPADLFAVFQLSRQDQPCTF